MEVNKKWKNIIITFALLIFVAAVITFKIIDYNNNEKEHLCAKIEATPSWTDFDGNLIMTGYIPINESDMEEFVDVLILDQIRFMYSLSCGWCNKQIQDFGDSWKRYEKSRLPIDCKKNGG